MLRCSGDRAFRKSEAAWAIPFAKTATFSMPFSLKPVVPACLCAVLAKARARAARIAYSIAAATMASMTSIGRTGSPDDALFGRERL